MHGWVVTDRGSKREEKEKEINGRGGERGKRREEKEWEREYLDN